MDSIFTVLTTTPASTGDTNLSSIINLLKEAKKRRDKKNSLEAIKNIVRYVYKQSIRIGRKKVLEAIDLLDSSQESEQIIQQTEQINSYISNYKTKVYIILEHEILKDSDDTIINIRRDIETFDNMLDIFQQALEKKMKSPSSLINLKQNIQTKEKYYTRI
ncbi:hypothetical protein [Bifidobacterium bifidum]|uniref:hypothetical protein n=1 Tax=Bifidobacterium bifidum TaxID=1681 RepID=UPI0012D46B9C|nr:hypothetical protein [Bifidobacterium bifidum]